MKIQPELIARIKQRVNAESVLDHLGFCIIRRSSKELRGPCKIHGGDNPTAFRFNLETKTWCCYTRHCEGDGSRDLVGLVQLATQQPFVDSVRFLAELCGIDLNNPGELSEEFRKLRQEQEMRKEIRQNVAPPVTSFYSEEIVESLLSQRSSYFEDRGFSKELLDFYDVGGMMDRHGVHRDTIPIRDENENLLTVSARRTDSDEDPKYVLLKDISKGATLYNLHVAKHYVGPVPDRTLILVEGFVDVWALAELGVYNVVAAMGTSLTPNQRNLLWKYAENIVVMFDADKAGREATPKVVEMLKWGADVRTIDLPDGKDPKNFKYTDLKEYGIGESDEL